MKRALAGRQSGRSRLADGWLELAGGRGACWLSWLSGWECWLTDSPWLAGPSPPALRGDRQPHRA